MESASNKLKYIMLPKTGAGLGKIADIYTTEGFDLSTPVNPSSTFMHLCSTEDISENTKSILRELLLKNKG